jgi:hypothetical protein
MTSALISPSLLLISPKKHILEYRNQNYLTMNAYLKSLFIPFLFSSIAMLAQQPTWQYVTTVGGNAQQSAASRDYWEGVRDIAVDKWGNTYVVGSIGSSPESNGVSPSPANYGGDFDAYVAKYDRCSNLQWMYVSGSSSSNEAWTGVAVDDEGNCYVNGSASNLNFRFVANGFDTTFIACTTSPCRSFAFWFKLNANGEKQWIKTVDRKYNYFVQHYIAMSPNNNLYMMFMRMKNSGLSDTIQGIPLKNEGHMLAKIDLNTGNIIRHSFIDSLTPFPYKSLTVDKDENIYAIVNNETNTAADSIKFIDGTRLIMPMYGSNIIKLDSNFHLLRAVTSKMAADGFYLQQLKLLRDRVVLNAAFNTGSSLGNLYFPVNHSRSSQNAIVSMNRNLDSIRVYFPDTAWTSHNSLLAGADPDNMYYMHTGVRILKWGAINRPTPPGGIVNDTTRIARVTTTNFWIENIDKLQDFAAIAGTYYNYDATVEDEQGNMYFAGEFADRITIHGKSVTPKGGSPSPDGFVLKWGLPCTDTINALIPPRDPEKLTATGVGTTHINLVWQDKSIYESGFRIYRSLDSLTGWAAIDTVPKNTTTYSDYTAQLNTIYWYKVCAYNARGESYFTNTDSAIIRTNCGPLVSSSKLDTACSSYLSAGGKVYTTSGLYHDTISRPGQCDSVVHLTLTIYQPSAATVNRLACGSYTWTVNGQTYTTSGTYTDTIVNVRSCDSVVTLNLTIGNTTRDTQYVSTCSAYTWPQNGQTYSGSGLWSDTLSGVANCDSIITLNLTVGNIAIVNASATACGSYTWPQNGQSYTTGGIYTDTVQGTSCDSVFMLNLTIGHVNTATQNVNSCGSYIWSANGQTYTGSGQYTATLTNASGCDSVITLNLTIVTPTLNTQSATACNSYTWPQNGNIYTGSGQYRDTLKSTGGCDSVIVTLNLTINTAVVSTEPTDQTAALGTNAQFNLAAQGTGLSYQWQRDLGAGFQNITNGGQFSGATTNTQTVSSVTLSNNNNRFRCIVSSGNCRDTSATAILNVYDPNGIAETSLEQIKVYPNPTSAVLHVDFDHSDLSGYTISVKDLPGKVVMSKANLQQKNTLDLSALSKGSYLISITDASSRIVSVKQVVLE